MSYVSSLGPFRSAFSEHRFTERYRHEGCETWELLAKTLAWEVCGGLVPDWLVADIEHTIATMQFIPGGRYLYYAGRPNRFWNNCFLLGAEEDTREEWGALSHRSINCLMTGGGIGNELSVIRPRGTPIVKTGGTATGPIALAQIINDAGRQVRQGGARRSAIWAGLDWNHGDAHLWLHAKDWDNQPSPILGRSMGDLKRLDFNFPCPLDSTNISLNYGDEWLALEAPCGNEIFRENIRMGMMNGEPGFSFNFGPKRNEKKRNACTEVTSEDDSDVCNLGSLNLSRIATIGDFRPTVQLATIFLLCGTLRAVLPYDKVYQVREKNRRLGLGLMGVHEWLLRRGHGYEVVPELHEWLKVYRDDSDQTARDYADELSVSRPVANRAIAPTGTIGIMAGTTTGIEPLFAVAYKRRFLNGDKHFSQYVIEPIAKHLVEEGVDPDSIETALSLASNPEKRIRFQADIQDYVDMGISSTINLPFWGSPENNPDKVTEMAEIVSRYAPRLRGLTFYPDGARGGQPLNRVAYNEALKHEGKDAVEESMDVCDLTKGGSCGE